MSAFAQAKPHKVVFGVTSPDEKEWGLALGNIRNLVAGLGEENVEVEVVGFGPGLGIVLKGSPVEADVQALEAKHVKFVACQNAMRARKVTADGLGEGVGQVPAGIVEVVTKQEQGFIYIKGGY